MQEIVIEKNQSGQRLDKFLHKYLPEAGTGFLYKMLRKKNIVLNGQKANGNEILNQGDQIKMFFAPDTFEKLQGKSNDSKDTRLSEYRQAFRTFGDIPVLYEDEDYLILNKPVGVLSQKAEKEDLSINEWMIGYLLHKGAMKEEDLQTFRPSVCNRLDRNTSGIVLCGKSLPGSQILSRMIADRSISKFYHTICAGVMEETLDLDGYLKKDAKTNRVSITKENKGGDASYIHTSFLPLKHTEKATLLEVELFTGKTHQIRAHLSDIGHPIIGDPKYGKEKVNAYFKQTYGLKYQLLHAKKIEFPTFEGKASGISGLKIEAPYPEQFQKIHDGVF